VLPGAAHNRALTWEIAIRPLCIKEESVIVHTPHGDD
jgi:hypothetical protein